MSADPITIILALTDYALRRRLSRELGALPSFRVIAQTADLMGTYNEVEEKVPAAVLISQSLAAQPEFEVMRALFSTLDVRWLIVHDKAVPRLQPVHPPRSDLFRLEPNSTVESIAQMLLSVTRSRQRGVRVASAAQAASPSEDGRIRGTADRLILIGASTGGVDALLTVLSGFPADCPPTFVVQHTGGGFGRSLAQLLDRQCAARVRLAEGGETVGIGDILIAAGTRAHLLLQARNPGHTKLERGDPVSGHIPSVDAMFKSALPHAPKVAAALLTGMGRDGAEGLKALRDAGAATIAQDEATSVVYGMPRAAVQLGAAQVTLPLPQIGPALLRACRSSATERRAVTR